MWREGFNSWIVFACRSGEEAVPDHRRALAIEGEKELILRWGSEDEMITEKGEVAAHLGDEDDQYWPMQMFTPPHPPNSHYTRVLLDVEPPLTLCSAISAVALSCCS